MCSKETYNKVCVCTHLSDSFPIQNGLKHGYALSPLLFNFDLKYAIRKVQENQVGLKLNETHHMLVYINDVVLLGDNIDIIKKNTETLINATKGVGLEAISSQECWAKLWHKDSLTDVLKMWHSSDIWE
jgi:hypothetical protein